jgi:hypothetical protein
MSYLDVAPMMVSLRTTPEEFEVKDGWLRHIPSRHDFLFDRDGRAQIRAHCNCAMLAVKSEQEPELYDSYRTWQTSYWQPLQINREFASHFQPRSAVRRLLIAIVGRIHRRLLQRGHAHHDHGVLMPAE